MTSLRRSPFLFAACQVGSEPLLKKEITANHADLRFSFSRPGFVTFKSTSGDLPAEFELKSIFARAYGLSTKKSSPEEIIQFARELRDGCGTRLRLHLWERDFHAPGEEPRDFERGKLEQETLTSIKAAAGSLFDSLFLANSTAEPGDIVLDVIALEADQLWLGYHLHTQEHSRWPGGRPPVTLPEEAPSRAYLKVEEAAHWADIPFKAGDTAVEIGSAPGGATYALLQRGLKVTGIDPGEMARVVLSHPGFTYVRAQVQSVRRDELPSDVQWLLLDMNMHPRISIPEAERLAQQLKSGLFGVILTVKLNDPEIADDLPAILERIQRLGMSRVRATQLPSNRREICVYGLTRLGSLRRRT